MSEKPETPEWDKMLKIKEQWVAVEEFVETILNSNAVIADYQPSYQQGGLSTRDRVLTPLGQEERDLLIAEHFDIDLIKVKQEQESVLDYWAEKKS